MATTATATPTNNIRRLNGRARAQIVMLSAQFLLGMSENLIGKPSDVSGFDKAASATILILHVLIGLGLLAGAGLTIRFASGYGGKAKRLALLGAAGVITAFTAGVLDMALKTGNSWWSFLMAVGFLAGFIAYGALLVNSKRN